MLDRDPLDAARKVGFPVGLGPCDGVDGRALFIRQVTVPAEIHQHLHGEFRISILDFGTSTVDAFGQQVVTIPLHAKAGAEGQTTFRDRLGHVVEVRRARMLHFGSAPAWPWHTVIVPIGGTTHGLQRRPVERVLVCHVQLDPLGRLAGIADCPHPGIELPRDAFDVRRIRVVHLDVAEEAVRPAELVGEHADDFMVSLGLEQRINHLVAPLERPVGRRDRAISLELGTGRQQINTIGAVLHDGRDGRIRVHHDKHVELFHRRFHLFHAGLRVRRMPPENHRPDRVWLIRVCRIFQNPVDPAADRDTFEVHQVLVFAIGSFDGLELALQPFEILTPDPCPVSP